MHVYVITKIFSRKRICASEIVSKYVACSCTLGSNVNKPLPSNKIVVLDKNINSTLIRGLFFSFFQ